MKQPEDLIINDWNTGIAPSALTGFQDMRNVDVSKIPGSVLVNFSLAKTSSTTVTDDIKWIVKDPASGGKYYALGDTGKVYKSDTGVGGWTLITGNTTNADSPSGQGLAVYKGYLFVARSTLIDIMEISDESWDNGWKSIDTDAHWHPMVVGQDDILYIGAGAGVFSVTSFADGEPPTATVAQALDLPVQYRVKCIAELGKNLMIGTIVGTNTYGGERVADIFPWDRISSSFNLPIRLNDAGVHQLITKDNILYAVAGFQGSIYKTNGSSVQYVRKLPENLNTSYTTGFFYTFFPGAIMTLKNRIYFGVSSGTTGSGEQGLGVYSLGEDGTLVFENQISTDTTTNANNLFVSALLPINNDVYVVAWRDNSTYGIDAIDSNRYGSYKAFIDSPLYEVGTPDNKKTFSQCDIFLSRPLNTSNQAVRIKYRLNPTASYSTLGTLEYDNDGAAYFKRLDAGPIADAVFVQFRIELQESGAVPFALKEIRLR